MVKNFTGHLNETILKDKIKFQTVTQEAGLEFSDVKVHFKVGLCHRPNQINEMNDARGGRCFQNPLK